MKNPKLSDSEVAALAFGRPWVVQVKRRRRWYTLTPDQTWSRAAADGRVFNSLDGAMFAFFMAVEDCSAEEGEPLRIWAAD